MNAGSRVLITARDHPWVHHTGTVTDEPAPPNLGFDRAVDLDNGVGTFVAMREVKQLAAPDPAVT